MPRTTRPPMIGETPTTRAPVRTERFADARAPPGSGRSRRPGSTARSARRRPPRSPRATPGAGRRGVDTRVVERAPGCSAARCRVHHSWKCIARSRRWSTTIVSTSASVMGSRRAPSGQRARHPLEHLGGRETLAQPSGAGEVRAEVEVAEREPRPAGAPLLQLVVDALAVARATPAALGVVDAGEGVDDRVDVGLEADAREPQVVAGVDHDRERVGCRDAGIRSSFERCTDAEGEPEPDAAGQDDDAGERRTSVATVKARIRPQRAAG